MLVVHVFIAACGIRIQSEVNATGDEVRDWKFGSVGIYFMVRCAIFILHTVLAVLAFSTDQQPMRYFWSLR